MLISIGEILVDIFDDGVTQTALPGGAPFNVACNTRLYIKEVSFIGAVGNDSYGKMLTQEASKKDFKNLNIKVLNDRYTSKAIVTLDNGERSFRFDRDGGSDYLLTMNDIDFSSIKDEDIIHLGSLMLSYDIGVSFFKEVINKIKAISNAKISFDINYRSDIFRSVNEAKKTFMDALKMVDIIKFSLEDIELLLDTDDVLKALKELLNENQIAIVSLGKEGSLFYKNGHVVKQHSYPVKPIDTTGAGDAFYSYVLASFVKDPSFIEDDEKIKYYLSRANVAGALTTLKKGAINSAPTSDEIETFLLRN